MKASLRALLLLGSLALGPVTAGAVEPDEILGDATLEARARDLSAHLRCMVCQNESIDDSHAPLARDLRLLVRERLKVGDSDEAIRDYLVRRYGDFILLKPPLKAETLALWGAPLIVLIVGAAAIIANMRRRDANALAPKELSEAEAAKLKSALERDHS
ncbi:cytochrome C biogenesis protein [Methylocella silvestris]|uniref:Cytochrome c-type biogenesis protein n=2 Tax=Methylocella silvestris TaxID=199596 RepID=A0A2J7TH24_METSI|nr:cytochrome c-type biogenesis protein [Methylocella silvestris]PNG26056.1 cytochrome C biogenesis protein [Methylocella silvestris]